MKHEYVGDHKDFYKYSLLRYLAEAGVRVNVCWMLTKAEDHKKPRDWAYLHIGNKENPWRRYDPKVFDVLERLLKSDKRDIGEIAKSGLIPGASFFNEPFLHDKRRDYFTRFANSLRPLINEGIPEVSFFDPDTGFTKGLQKDKEDRHITLQELVDHYNLDKSLLVIQFPSRNETPLEFAEKRVGNVVNYFKKRGMNIEGLICCLDCWVTTDRWKSVLYFLICQRSHLPTMSKLVTTFVARWNCWIRWLIRFDPGLVESP